MKVSVGAFGDSKARISCHSTAVSKEESDTARQSVNCPDGVTTFACVDFALAPNFDGMTASDTHKRIRLTIFVVM